MKTMSMYDKVVRKVTRQLNIIPANIISLFVCAIGCQNRIKSTLNH